ncbi:MAG: hypothetical protein IPP29_18725 [Bacteroidetes bacterium]|nr:hypothetical protein [Bacteroidota bacterium]
MIPVLVSALQEEHQSQIKYLNLKMRITKLKNEIVEINNASKHCAMKIRHLQKMSKNKKQQRIQNALYQNQPNPFNQQTVISYQITQETKNAKIIIRDLKGGLLKSFSIEGNGKDR